MYLPRYIATVICTVSILHILHDASLANHIGCMASMTSFAHAVTLLFFPRG